MTISAGALFGTVVLQAALLAGAAAGGAQMNPDFYVSPDGNDAWSGKLPEPASGRKDGPFATLERAQRAVRELRRASPGLGRPVVVAMRGGVYELAGPVVFAPEDSGSPDSPTLYTAWKGERPVLSGGVRLTGWSEVAKGRWQARLPEAPGPGWVFSQLFVNGERRRRPRLPKEGYFRVAGELSPSPRGQGKGHDRFRYRAGDILPEWAGREDVELLIIHIWSMSRMRIAEVDARERTVRLGAPSCNTSAWAAIPAGARYIAENVREALSRPGEWYLDREARIVTYLPLLGEDMRKAVVVAPRADRLLVLAGDVKARRWVEHLTFRGIEFAFTNWNLSGGGRSFPQAEADMDGAISAIGARHCRFESCSVAHTGAYALSFGAGCKHDSVVSCELFDLGAGGIKIGEMGASDDEEAVASHNTVSDCLIASGGRMHPAAVGVWIGHSPHNTVEHCEIADFYYTGISPGWSWGYGRSHAHHNTIAYNHIHDIGQGVLSDMGGIYTLGVSPGTVLHHNLIHDVESFDYGGWGIYFDEGSTDIVAEDNIAYRTKSAPFHQHYGKNNIVRNNIFAFGREAQLMRSRAEEHLSFTLTRNIVYWKEGSLLGSNWSGSNYSLDWNCYWNASGEPVSFAGASLEDWRARGQDVHSIVADPLFVDPEKGDFRLRPGSPALGLGFKPIDMSRTGRLARSGPRAYPPREFPPPPGPEPIEDDFEDTPPGEKVALATTYEESDKATIRITEETAASGRRSVKFTDAPGQKQSWNPHMHYSPNFTSGVLEGRFALRMEPGAVFFHEWRDAHTPYRVGPSLRVESDGRLLVGGKELARIPLSRWVRFEISCGLGEQATGTWELVVRPEGGAPSRFSGLPCSREFRSVRWFGFVADAREKAVFYLDDVRLGPARAAR